MRDLSGPERFDQLRTQLARAAAGVTREKLPQQRPRATRAKPDGGPGEAGTPGSS